LEEPQGIVSEEWKERKKKRMVWIRQKEKDEF